ncbi:DUF1990 family protein [Allosaccharopolyspora coralli]|uniref:DUF1990 family protein n=1 Tax=Allosaccharopolyspora coralli TaxID=2665642 RepID=A0A5Q3QBU5_9PSEU|nr:DUF1990 family protein [Allosaccharopolyspora coralli]QGK70704.1 DUF1990 family protein [Allosaccharopolyspora coralli]
MAAYPKPRASTIVLRWLVGTILVSWRYLWQITPLHRNECTGTTVDDLPPDLPTELVDDAVQLADSGFGPFYHRCFRAEIVGADVTTEELLGWITADFKRFVPSEVVDVRSSSDSDESLSLGDEFVVDMPGPWDGPVRVVQVDDTCLRLVTLRGHLEAGQVQFHAYSWDEVLVFEIRAWARPSTPLVRWLYSKLRLAKEIQLNMWVRFCCEAARQAGGRLQNGIRIRTHRLPADARVQRVSA